MGYCSRNSHDLRNKASNLWAFNYCLFLYNIIIVEIELLAKNIFTSMDFIYFKLFDSFNTISKHIQKHQNLSSKIFFKNMVMLHKYCPILKHTLKAYAIQY